MKLILDAYIYLYIYIFQPLDVRSKSASSLINQFRATHAVVFHTKKARQSTAPNGPVDKQISRILYCLYSPRRHGWPTHSTVMVFHSTPMSDINHFRLARGAGRSHKMRPLNVVVAVDVAIQLRVRARLRVMSVSRQARGLMT